MSATPQRALQYDPGRFRALFAFKPTENTAEGRKNLTLAAATLLKELESDQLNKKPLNVLVAVSWELLDDSRRQLLKEEYSELPKGQHSDVLIQVAAETEDERTYARRLIQRVFKGSGEKVLEYYGGRHALSREAFGFAEVSLPQTTPPPSTTSAPPPRVPPVVPMSPAGQGASWLLFQRYVQEVDKFYAQDPEKQEAVIGRPRTPQPDPANPNATYEGTPGSHIALERKLNGTPSRLLRRSFSYESYDEEGLLFLACAKTAKELQSSLQGFGDDPLKHFVTPKECGLYVVPPNANWLTESKQVKALGAKRPPMEEIFYPEFPLVLYEVTPLTLQFFKRVFHAHKDNFDDRGKLREDLKLLTKGLAKLLYGASIPTNSPLFRFLSHAFEPDTSAPVASEVEREQETASAARVTSSFKNDLEGLSKERLEHNLTRQTEFLKAIGEGAKELAHATSAGDRLERARELVTQLDKSFDAKVQQQRERVRTELEQPQRIKKAYGSPQWLDKSGVELLSEMIVNDAETMSGRPKPEKADLESLVDLCEQAAAEARAINEFVGYYMTFVC
jgi:deferrochelatase/peroxidase EfeB